MLRKFLMIMLGAMFLLAACNTDATGEKTDGEMTHSEEGNENRSFEENEKENKGASQSLNDLEEIFQRMKAATQSIKSVSITGNNKMENTIAGTTMKSTMEMKVDATIEPFVQHAVYTVIDGEGGKTEWYATDDEMYVNLDDSGWEKEDHPVSVEAASLIHRDDYFDHFILYKDLFELKEDNDHYIITYIGPDEQYKEVFYGTVIAENFGEMVQKMSGLMEDINMSGTVEMKVSKKSFLIVEQHTKYTSSMEKAGISMTVSQDGTYAYTYNEIGNIEIPEEVVKHAKK